MWIFFDASLIGQKGTRNDSGRGAEELGEAETFLCSGILYSFEQERHIGVQVGESG